MCICIHIAMLVQSKTNEMNASLDRDAHSLASAVRGLQVAGVEKKRLLSALDLLPDREEGLDLV